MKTHFNVTSKAELKHIMLDIKPCKHFEGRLFELGTYRKGYRCVETTAEIHRDNYGNAVPSFEVVYYEGNPLTGKSEISYHDTLEETYETVAELLGLN